MFLLLRKWKADSGNTILEMALVLPLFFLLIFGFINFALVSFGLCNITFGTHRALRYATLHSNTSYTPATAASVNAVIQAYVYQYPKNTATTTVTYSGNQNVVGQTVTVTSTVTYTIRLPGYTYSGLALKIAESGIIIM